MSDDPQTSGDQVTGREREALASLGGGELVPRSAFPVWLDDWTCDLPCPALASWVLADPDGGGFWLCDQHAEEVRSRG